MHAELSSDLMKYCRTEGVDPYTLRRDVQAEYPMTKLRERYDGVADKLAVLGVEATIADKAAFFIDDLVCSEYQLPAIACIEVGGDFDLARKIANRRLLLAAATFSRIGGIATATWGVSDASPTKAVGAAGFAVKIGSELIKYHTQNEVGSEWRLLLTDKLQLIRPYQNVFNAQLKQAGFADDEIRSIQSLPNGVYLAELAEPNLSRMSNGILPVACAAAMAGYENYGLAALTAALGFASFPFGEMTYKESNKNRAAQNRAGQSAGVVGYLRRVAGEHIRMTDRNNTISRADEIITIGLLLGNSAGNLFANLNGLRYGLTGLNGALTQQRAREDSRRSIEFTQKLIGLISSDKFILTEKRWKEHIDKAGSVDLEEAPIESGLIVRDFKTVLPDGKHTELPPVNVVVSSGEVVVLKAQSGLGKSSLLAGLMHFSEHEGDLYIVENGQGKNIHTLDNPSRISERITYIAPDVINSSDQLVDVFKREFELQEVAFESDDDYERMQWEVGINMSDSLLMAEFEKHTKGEKVIFNPRVLELLRSYRKSRLEWVNTLLSASGGNLSKESVNGERVFSTLSAGEKQRASVLLALARAKSNIGTKAIILDEPLAQLDEGINLPCQLRMISEILELPEPPALVIISHQHNDRLSEQFGAKVIDLENGGGLMTEFSTSTPHRKVVG